MRVMLLTIVQLPLLLTGKALRCGDPPDESCVQLLVATHRSALEEARSRDSLSSKLAALGLGQRGVKMAAIMLESLPRFDDEMGRPLNEAAVRLLRADDVQRPASPSTAQGSIDNIPSARISNGTWKYVLLEIQDSEGRRKTLVRSTAYLIYHAQMASAAMRELKASNPNVKTRVLGGGRISFAARAQTISIFGYSKTYGRCEPCNRQAAEILRQTPRYAQYHVHWSNDGY
jgi:phosphohistidine phosphatase